MGLAFFIFPMAEHETFSLLVVPNVPQRRRQRERAPGHRQKLAHIPYPASPNLRQSKRHRLLGSVLIEAASGPRQMDMAIPVELTTIGVQRPEDADDQALFLGSVQQVVGGQGEKGTKEPAVGLKQWPQGIGQGESAVLVRRIRQTGHHGGNPQVGGFFPAGWASAAVAALVNKPVMRAISVAAMEFAGAHQRRTASQHFGNDIDFDRPYRVAGHDVSPGTVALE